MSDFADLGDWYAQPLGRRYLRRCWEAIRPLIAPVAGRSVLDIGCGAGHYSELLKAEGAEVTGIDPDAKLLAEAKRRVPKGHFQVAGAEDLPFADGRFEAVLCSNALEFVGDQARALAEMRRVTSGRAVLCVLNRQSLWGLQQQLFRPFSNHPYYRGQFFSSERLQQLATASGWRVTTLTEAVRFAPVPVEPLLGWLDGWGPGACWVTRLE